MGNYWSDIRVIRRLARSADYSTRSVDKKISDLVKQGLIPDRLGELYQQYLATCYSIYQFYDRYIYGRGYFDSHFQFRLDYHEMEKQRMPIENDIVNYRNKNNVFISLHLLLNEEKN